MYLAQTYIFQELTLLMTLRKLQRGADQISFKLSGFLVLNLNVKENTLNCQEKETRQMYCDLAFFFF